MRRPIASESRLLEAPEGGGQRGSVEAVDPYRTGAQRARNAMRDVHVIGPDRGGQAVDRVIGEGHCLALVRERRRREHRSEDLLPGYAHRRAHGIENRGLDVVAAGLHQRPLPAEDDSGAFGHTAVDVAENTLHVSAVDQRTHLRCRLERVAKRDRARDPRDLGKQSVLHLLVNDHA